MLAALIVAALAAQVATEPQVPIGPYVPPQQTLRLPTGTAPPKPAKPAERAEPERPRIPIDLGPDAPMAEPPQQIDILAPPQTSEAANAAELKECEDQTERGVVAGEIVVCRALPADTSQLYSGSREAWLKAYAERTKGPSTPDVDGSGLPAGMVPMITIIGCFFGPCPKPPALMIDVEAIATPPAGSDAERVAQGLKPVEGDDAPLDADARGRIAAELGLPEASETQDTQDNPRSP